MILEGIVTTISETGAVNVAPMGPVVPDAASIEQLDSFQLRVFQSSQTFRNLRRLPCGVLHVVDDVMLVARAAIGVWETPPATVPATRVQGAVLRDACRWYEFELEQLDATHERAELDARVVHHGRMRDFWGFNRGKHAVLEAAILATRVSLLGRQMVLQELARLKQPLDKTGGAREQAAFRLLTRFVEQSPAESSDSVTGTQQLVMEHVMEPADRPVQPADQPQREHGPHHEQ